MATFDFSGANPSSIEYGADTIRAIMGVGISGDAVPVTQIMFGTDFPSGSTSNEVVNALAGTDLINDNDMRSINHDNAVRLFHG
jgi:predicted TIM-barrel fold metal-dependent hydrolase